MLVAHGIMSVFMGNPQNIFLNDSSEATARNASIPAAVDTPHGAITSEKVIRHNHKAQGRFWGTGTVTSVNRYHLLKT